MFEHLPNDRGDAVSKCPLGIGGSSGQKPLDKEPINLLKIVTENYSMNQRR